MEFAIKAAIPLKVATSPRMRIREVALRLLPRLRAVLEEGEGTAEEKLARVKEALGMGRALLLEERVEGMTKSKGSK